MAERIAIIGLDEPEYREIRERLAERGSDLQVLAHEVLPRAVVRDGALLLEARRGPGLLPVSRVVFHAIYEEDHDFIAALALWGRPMPPERAGDARLPPQAPLPGPRPGAHPLR